MNILFEILFGSLNYQGSKEMKCFCFLDCVKVILCLIEFVSPFFLTS